MALGLCRLQINASTVNNTLPFDELFVDQRRQSDMIVMTTNPP